MGKTDAHKKYMWPNLFVDSSVDDSYDRLSVVDYIMCMARKLKQLQKFNIEKLE